MDMKILVVDDMATMRKLIKHTLGKMGFTNIEDADDGTSAWTKLTHSFEDSDPFQLVLSDWNMPKMSGLELLKKVRNSADLQETPFIIITGEAKEGYLESAENAGVDNFMLKPVNDFELKEKILELFPED